MSEQSITQNDIDQWRVLASQGGAVAQYNMGYAHFHGIGVEKSAAKAIEYWKKAADQGQSTACYELGQAYMDGFSDVGVDIPKNCSEALDYFKKATADGQSFDAPFMVAVINIYGHGNVLPNAAEGERYLNMAQQRGMSIPQEVFGALDTLKTSSAQPEV